MVLKQPDQADARPPDDLDPVLSALRAAPLDDEPLTAADEDAVLEAQDALRRGAVVSGADLRRRYGVEVDA